MVHDRLGIDVVSERGQPHPADWPGEFVSFSQFQDMVQKRGQVEDLYPEEIDQTSWIDVGHVNNFPVDGGATIHVVA